jgi:fused signal recognition particle receptor
MLQHLTDFCRRFYQSLQATGWYKEIIGAGLALLLLILLIDIIRRRKKAEKLPAVETRADPAQTEETRSGQPADFHEIPGPEPEQEIEQPGPAGAETHPPPAAEPVAPEPASLMDRLKTGLGKTRKSLAGRLEQAFADKSVLDRQNMEEIEEALITADVGMDTTMKLIGRIEANAAQISGPEQLRTFLKQEMRKVFENVAQPTPAAETPHVVMVVGVNGVGKTTTIGKLAFQYRCQGAGVLIGAADTFRAAAVEQLTIWAQRADAAIVAHRENTDPAAVAFDTVEAGISRGIDRVIIDTAGRLHTKVNLMEQLKKIKRSIGKKLPGAPHEVLLVLDATTGQNALAQAKMFHEGIGVTGLIIPKLDGTARGGIVVGICDAMKLPIHYIGVGEAMEDLQPFDHEAFIDALF